MKKSLTTQSPLRLAAICLGLALTGAAVAAPPGGIGTTPAPQPAGDWRARVKYLHPHSGPDGRYLTWSYADIVASSQESCDAQLQTWYSGGNTVIVEYCHLVPFGG
ncbi:hypothetical protein J5226_11465 [Lysobacter sp. K5869]|uniref:hypothetical protein n=1 Tax=Lysobacter sp. K5869 TaxID=2820808 RepID=UPI001C060CD1|nr:hypothetical protein [Lysobacter sp. K5869]QWP78961.1 hypothetical protein J5226_11465 [Lysobacter sp. K5869]